ncbi:MAG TPA: ornithine cyclodeaminase family protein [Dehalococcoidia bacterium]|nr:ornithine cyclodeaminase family protein [Dehalococcoidia bacterium]
MLLLNRDEVKRLLDMAGCIEAVEKAFAELASGTAVMPLRINLFTPDGLALYMPAYLKKMGALSCKVVTSYKANPQKHGLPTIMGKMLLQDPETGDVICTMDAAYLTAVRTGAASGVATKYLARHDRGQTAVIFGAGVQARAQLWAMTVVRDIARAYVYDISREAVRNFIQEMGEQLDLEIVAAESPERALEEADIICTATSSPTPVFPGEKVREGTHLNCVGSHTPETRELDSAIIKRAKIIADSRQACLNEAGDIIIPLREGAIKESHLYAELGEVVTSKKPSRTDDKEITLFKSTGLAIQDAAAAKLVYDKAVAMGIGTEVEL